MSRKTENIAQKLGARNVELKLDGRNFPIVITTNVIIEAEQVSGENLLTGTGSMFKPSATVVRAILWAALRRAGAKYSLDDVGDLINPANIVQINEAILTAWAASMPAPTKAEESPTEPTTEQ
jgi:hypothetical protein